MVGTGPSASLEAPLPQLKTKTMNDTINDKQSIEGGEAVGKPAVRRSKHWECNECGGSDWTDAIGEWEIEQELVSCSLCGGTEFHLADDCA